MAKIRYHQVSSGVKKKRYHQVCSDCLTVSLLDHVVVCFKSVPETSPYRGKLNRTRILFKFASMPMKAISTYCNETNFQEERQCAV